MCIDVVDVQFLELAEGIVQVLEWNVNMLHLVVLAWIADP